jgi:predicted peroxiredoxin
MHYIRLFTLLAALLLPLHALADAPADNSTKGLFVIITNPDPMTQMMALVLSSQTVAQEKSVQILLCGPGGDLALKESQEVVFKPLDKSPQMLLNALIGKGIAVEVCPLYLPNTEKTEADLISGVTVAKPPVVAEKLRAEGIKLFTF